MSTLPRYYAKSKPAYQRSVHIDRNPEALLPIVATMTADDVVKALQRLAWCEARLERLEERDRGWREVSRRLNEQIRNIVGKAHA